MVPVVCALTCVVRINKDKDKAALIEKRIELRKEKIIHSIPEPINLQSYLIFHLAEIILIISKLYCLAPAIHTFNLW